MLSASIVVLCFLAFLAATFNQPQAYFRGISLFRDRQVCINTPLSFSLSYKHQHGESRPAEASHSLLIVCSVCSHLLFSRHAEDMIVTPFAQVGFPFLNTINDSKSWIISLVNLTPPSLSLALSVSPTHVVHPSPRCWPAYEP